MTYAELEERSLRLAQLLHARGLRPGGHVAVMMENQPRYFDVVWAGMRSGLHVTPVNRYLTAGEAGYILLAWWGPILHEYYAGSESLGMAYAGPQDWLAHPGTVGQVVSGELHICDDAGREVGPGETGLIYFARDRQVFAYHNAPDKTRSAHHPDHPYWATLGDGWLYLTDRKSFMIVAGGVNIYPQEIEDVLVAHPKVTDVAVLGVPNPDLGEEVKAVVELAEGIPAGPEVADELLAYARERLARYKVPRSVDFVDELPRLPTGKLYKRLLRDRYWPEGAKIP